MLISPSYTQSLASKVTFFKRTTKNDQNEGVLPPKSDKNKEDLGFDLQTLWGVNISTSKQTPVPRKAYEHEMSYWQKNVL